MNIIKIDTTHSTNSYLKELASQQKLEEGSVVVVRNQTSGRGQAGNSWESEPGKNLTFSIIFYPHFLPVKNNFLISEIISLSLKEVLDHYIDHIRIKWPNDIYYKDEKIAGVLIENELIGNEIAQSVVGIGLNVNQENFTRAAKNPVSMKQILDADVDLDLLLNELINQILLQYQNLQEEDPKIVVAAYHNALYRNIGYHPFSDKDGTFTARIESVEDNGTLNLVTEDDIVRQYIFKEVTFC